MAWASDTGDTMGRALDELTAILAKGQAADGYLNSWYGADGRQPWSDITHGHEMYCAGHLVQAAVAAARTRGDGPLLEIACRFADLLVERFGSDDGPAGSAADGRRAEVPGHPEVETALVELWRHTGERRYLDLASRFVERRGYGTLGYDHFGSAYFQDHRPLRESPVATGHAVRQLYLLAGAADVAVENGDTDLLDAVERIWESAVDTKMAVTGGHGSRHRDEAYGDAYELPPDQGYNETCASIASVMCSWRLLLATGRRRYADELERALYNGVAAGVSADGERFFYVNPLQLRADHEGGDRTVGIRQPWYGCACCPPNVARLAATLHHMVATADPDGVQVHLYSAGRIVLDLPSGRVELDVETDYPWDGTITVRVVATGDGPWELALRRPEWSATAFLVGPGDGSGDAETREHGGYLRLTRRWAVGDQVSLSLDLTPRLVEAHPAADALRGCVAVMRGPLVYCLEGHDQPDGVRLDDLEIDTAAPMQERRLPDGTVGVSGFGVTGANERWGSSPYRSLADVERTTGPEGRHQASWAAIPYYRWANRSPAPMRVWVPAL